MHSSCILNHISWCISTHHPEAYNCDGCWIHYVGCADQPQEHQPPNVICRSSRTTSPTPPPLHPPPPIHHNRINHSILALAYRVKDANRHNAEIEYRIDTNRMLYAEQCDDVMWHISRHYDYVRYAFKMGFVAGWCWRVYNNDKGGLSFSHSVSISI